MVLARFGGECVFGRWVLFDLLIGADFVKRLDEGNFVDLILTSYTGSGRGKEPREKVYKINREDVAR